PEVIAGAARLAAEATRTIDDIRGSAAYRRLVTEVMVRRILEGIMEWGLWSGDYGVGIMECRG
ncbi:MAG: xanthine dehydrogenase family protein subunit M, partial [Thermoflexia bacterium]